jgi:hypothetical protein
MTGSSKTRPTETRPKAGRTLVAVSAVATVALLGSLVAPAFGGPHALSAANALQLAKKALKKANSADRRSKRALSVAQQVDAQGGQGPRGPQGAAGPPGKDAFGSLTYAEGAGATTSSVDYLVDVAPCPAGRAPTGGSAAGLAGAETGGTDAILGDQGDLAFDADDDGSLDSWAAYAYNASGSAQISATVACAPAGSATVAALPGKSAASTRVSDALREAMR